MPSFGENLRREREKRKITLDQISQSTKIGTRMLVALEEDRFNQLPGGIFNKGFVRAYARCVGLDEDQTVADYLQASGEAPPPLPDVPEQHPAPRIDASYENPQRQLPWGTFAAVLLLAALALSLWSHRQKKHESAAAPSAQPAATQPQAQSSPTPLPEPSPVSASATNSAPAPELSPVASPPPQKSGIAPGAEPATTPVAAPASPAGGGFVVNVLAREDSWTVITSDGRTVYSGILAAGDERTIRGHQEIVVRSGNAGAVDLFFNGKKVPHLGQSGEVRTITFGPDGVTPNRPSPPPTQ